MRAATVITAIDGMAGVGKIFADLGAPQAAVVRAHLEDPDRTATSAGRSQRARRRRAESPARDRSANPAEAAYIAMNTQKNAYLTPPGTCAPRPDGGGEEHRYRRMLSLLMNRDPDEQTAVRVVGNVGSNADR